MGVSGVVARLIDCGIELFIRKGLRPSRERVEMAEILIISTRALLARGCFLQHAGRLDIQALVVGQATSEQAFKRKPLIGGEIFNAVPHGSTPRCCKTPSLRSPLSCLHYDRFILECPCRLV